MKKLALLLATVAISTAAYAHRESFFVWTFPNDATMGHKTWSVAGVGDYAESDANFIVMPDGSFKHNGTTSICYTHDFTTGHGRTDWFAADNMYLRFIAGSDIDVNPHITPVVVVEGANGTATYYFDKAQSSLEITQEMLATRIEGDYRNLGVIKSCSIYFDNCAADEILSLEKINFYSDWYMPTVDPGKKAVVTKRDGTSVEEAGVTYIQAEDYDEKTINGRVAHSAFVAGGGNTYRDFETEDGPLYVACADGGCPFFYNWSLDGCEYGSNGHNFGVKNCVPNTEWGQYFGPYKDATSNVITLADAMDNFGTWFEYTFDALTDCTADFSICATTHGTPFSVILANGSEYYKKAQADHGFVVEGLDGDYFPKYAFGIRLYVDGVLQHTAWSTAPRFLDDDATTLSVIKDPKQWTNYQVTNNGQRENAPYMFTFPWPYADDGGQWVAYGTWHPFFISDLIDEMVARGDLADADAAQYRHGDFCDVPLTKGRHTIKVQTIGGLVFFDMIRILAKGEPSGIDGILADDPDDSAEPVYYDLNGRRVANPTSGIYVVRRGSKASKQIIM